MFEIIIYILLILSLIYGFYFLIMASGVFRKKKCEIDNNKKNHFAILIAARNEETVIKNLINSLKKQNYPSNKYDVYVIVNNCTDNTLEVAKNAGAKIIECKQKVKSKGEVLKYTFNKLKSNDEIDAYVIFDADNVVHREFLNKMNDSINCGYEVVQGFRDTKNICDNWLSTSYAILYYLQSLFINKSRFNFGMSSFLNGTGFMVKKETIDRYGYDPKTITEDIEYTAICAINGIKIAFNENAITYDEQVTDFKSSLKQRKRWSFGAIQCLKNYTGSLIKEGIKNKRFECFDVIIFYFGIIFHVLFTIVSLIVIFYNVFYLNNFNSMDVVIYFIMFLINYFIGVVFRMIVIKKCNKSIKENIWGILLFDLFVLSWFPINFICLFIKNCNWNHIKHDRNVDTLNI